MLPSRQEQTSQHKDIRVIEKMNNFGRGSDDEEEKGLLWKLPEVRFKDFGKVGPAFGLGAGCGVGFGVGLVGGKITKKKPFFLFTFLVLSSNYIK